MDEQENTAGGAEQAIGAFTDFIAYCEETGQGHDLTFDKLALQALQKKQERDKAQAELNYAF